MQIMNSYNTLESINISEWLQSNNLSNLIQPFVAQGVTVQGLVQMNAEQLQLCKILRVCFNSM